jgi:hypothetical protein
MSYTFTEDEDEIYVYMVYDEDNLIVNVYNEYMDALTYCVSELTMKDEDENHVYVDLFEYCAVIESPKGSFTIMGEPLVLNG